MKQILLIFIFLISYSCFSTVQQKDILCYNGNNYALKEYYLEEYFDKNPEKRPKSDIQSSDLWRGYVAIFTVFDNQVYLTDLKIRVHDEFSNEVFATKWESVFNVFFPSNDRFLVDWIVGLVLFPMGEAIDYESGFGITHNVYELLEIKNGVIIKTYSFSLKKYKEVFPKKNPFFLDEKDLTVLKKRVGLF